MSLNAIVGGIVILIIGFMIGRLTATKERTITMIEPRPADNAGANVEIEKLIREGHTIAAIKLYRKTYATDLKEAKDAVDAIAATLSS